MMNCVICEEPVTDDAAEMHDPKNPDDESGVCHAECGLGAGWEIS